MSTASLSRANDKLDSPPVLLCIWCDLACVSREKETTGQFFFSSLEPSYDIELKKEGDYALSVILQGFSFIV